MNYQYNNANAPVYLLATCIAFLFVGVALHIASKKQFKVSKYICFATLAIFLVLRIAIAYNTEGHSDMTSFFLPWSYNLAYGNFAEFYFADIATGEIQYLNDYPPMLMYVLWFIGEVVEKFALSQETWIFLMRIPACVCDIVAAYYILKLAVAIEKSKAVQPEVFVSRKNKQALQKIKHEKNISLINFPQKVSFLGFACMIMYLANPAMITDSAWWGQVDGVIAMFFAITIYNVYMGKDKSVVITAILAMCFKLQYIFFMPALGMYYLIRLKKEKMQLFSQLVKGVLIGGCLFLAINLPLCYLPMTNGHPLFMLDIYINQVNNYAYYTLNAPNLFGALNLNFIELPDSGTSWTLFVVGGVCVVVAISSFFGDSKNKIAVLGAFTIITVFMFSYKMHERYMIYALILLLIVYLQSGKLKDLIVYCGFTSVQFLTIGSIMAIDGLTFDFYDKRLQIISIICLTLYVGYVILISQAEVTARNHKLK